MPFILISSSIFQNKCFWNTAVSFYFLSGNYSFGITFGKQNASSSVIQAMHLICIRQDQIILFLPWKIHVSGQFLFNWIQEVTCSNNNKWTISHHIFMYYISFCLKVFYNRLKPIILIPKLLSQQMLLPTESWHNLYIHLW